MADQKFIFRCNDCGASYDASEVKYLCPACAEKNVLELPPKGVLKTIYDYQKLIESGLDFAGLKKNHLLDLLPVNSIESLPNLEIGNTPLYVVRELDHSKLPFKLFLKDDSQNPTYSFKDRASAVVSAFAKERGHEIIVTASTGNAGSSLAGVCAAQGQKAVVIVPATAPVAKLTQIMMYGARIVPVKGTYDDAFDLSIKATEEFGWYNRNTAFNPLTIEGKKTVAFELFEQLGHTIPDRIFVPVGDGVIISGVYKGFEDLLQLQIIEKMPCIVAVQAEDSDNLVRNLETDGFTEKESTTLADSISVNIPRNYHMAKDYIHKYEGEYMTVSDAEILEASSVLSKNTGLFAEPAAAAAFAGMLKCRDSGKLPTDSKNIVLLTGSGLKDLKAVKNLLNIPDAIEAELKNLKPFAP